MFERRRMIREDALPCDGEPLIEQEPCCAELRLGIGQRELYCRSVPHRLGRSEWSLAICELTNCGDRAACDGERHRSDDDVSRGERRQPKERAGELLRGVVSGGDDRASGTKTPSAATSLLSVPRMPSDCQVSMICTSLVRRARPTTTGPKDVVRACSPSKTMPVMKTHGES